MGAEGSGVAATASRQRQTKLPASSVLPDPVYRANAGYGQSGRLCVTPTLVLAAMTDRRLSSIVARLPPEPRRGRPWSCPLRQRVLVVCAALRTNLTLREVGALFGISKSTAHRIISTLTPQLAALAATIRYMTDASRGWSTGR